MHRDDESESPVSLTQEALEPSWVSPEVKNSYALPGLPPDASFEAVHAHCISGGISAAELEALCARFLQEHPGAEVIEQFHSRTAMAWEAQGQLELALSEYEWALNANPLRLWLHQRYWCLRKRGVRCLPRPDRGG